MALFKKEEPLRFSNTEKPDLEQFDFSVLWNDQEEGGLGAIIPIVSLVLQFVTIALIYFLK